MTSTNGLAKQDLKKLIPWVLGEGRALIQSHQGVANRPLIKEFFEKNPQFSVGDPMHPLPPKTSRPKTIAVIGGGPSGLIAAYWLARVGHSVTVYEKRSYENFALRWQNIGLGFSSLQGPGFDEFVEYIKNHDLIHYEMELDQPERIRFFRISIGDLQTALAELCIKHGVKLYFQQEVRAPAFPDADLILLASGANSFEDQGLAENFEFVRVHEQHRYGITGMRFEPQTDLPTGMIKERVLPSKNHPWGFNLVFVNHAVSAQAARMEKLSVTSVDEKESKFKVTRKNPAIHWNIFSAPSKDPNQELPFPKPDVFSFVDFLPSISQKGAILSDKKAVIAWGDTRVNPHPLTGSGTATPFRCLEALTVLAETFDHDQESINQYNESTDPIALEQFIKTLLVSLI